MSSAFGELLRRSRFASYDSAIPQAYCAPQAHARRGDYGLKRSLPLRYKDSSVTVSHVDHHARFTDWNNASPLVRFVDRFQELNITPRTMPSGSWDQSLGDAKLSWLIDSEFASQPLNPKSASNHHSKPFNTAFAFNNYSEPRDGLGRRGDGAYGAKRPPPQQSSYTPNPPQLNIMSLSSRKFKAYLTKLPTLSASYKEYLWDQQKALDSSSQPDHNVLYITSQPQFSPQKFHRSFLAKHFSATAPPVSTSKSKKVTTPTVSVSQNIERQPHRTGGLMYTHYSPLETVHTTPSQPGFVFQEKPDPISKFFADKRYRQNVEYLSLVGGIITNLNKRNAHIHLPFYYPRHDVAVGGKPVVRQADPVPGSPSGPASDPDPTIPPWWGNKSTAASKTNFISFNELLQPPSPPDPADQADPLQLRKATAQFRITSFAVRSPPTAVATYQAHLSRPKDLLDSMSVSVTSIVDAPKLPTANLHRIGSMEYSGHLELAPKNRFYPTGNESAKYDSANHTSEYGVTYRLANEGQSPNNTWHERQMRKSNFEARFSNNSQRAPKMGRKIGDYGNERKEIVDRSGKTN